MIQVYLTICFSRNGGELIGRERDPDRRIGESNS